LPVRQRAEHSRGRRERCPSTSPALSNAETRPTGSLLDGDSAAHDNGRMNQLALRHAAAAALALCAIGLPSRGAAQTRSAPATPSPSIAKDSRTFELRTYYATPGKLEELHARFRNHTIRLFKKHGMTIVGFWAPTTPAAAAANTLVYVLAYPSDQAREAAWKGFNTDPEWIAARDASERKGKIVERVESVMMKATDYSDLK
jgi:hypothetical protein